MQIFRHKPFDLEAAFGELYSTSSILAVRHRSYEAITSLSYLSRVLVLSMLSSKRRVRRTDRIASETELLSDGFVFTLARVTSEALKLALKLGT